MRGTIADFYASGGFHALSPAVETCIIAGDMSGELHEHESERCGLAIETSGHLGCVALGQGDRVLESRTLSGPRRHAVEFMPNVAAICQEHGVKPGDLGVVYVSVGPGSFTGLRIGVTAARTIAMATEARLVGVPTLSVVAANALDATPPPQRVVVLLDAKRKHVYAAAFDLTEERYVPVAEPVEAEPRTFLEAHFLSDASCAVLGEGVPPHREAIESAAQASGWTILAESLNAPRAETVYKLGRVLAAAGAFVDRRDFVPTYVRPPEAEEKWLKRRQGAS